MKRMLEAEATSPGNAEKRRTSELGKEDEWPYEVVNDVDSCPFPDIEVSSRLWPYSR